MITENYIKMCEKNEEIQKACKYKKGDWFYCDENFYITNKDLPYINVKNLGKHIWLPTQEQLQELTKRGCYENNNFKSFISDFYYYLFDEYEEIDKCESLNEAWLSFYMSEKYNKIWENGEWVKC